MRIHDFLELTDCLPEALILMDEAGKFLALNRKAETTLGLDREHVIGRNLGDFTDTTRFRLEANLRLWRRSREPVPANVYWRNGDGSDACGLMQCHGFLLQPRKETEPCMIVLRCVAGNKITRNFITLNQEIVKHKRTLKKLLKSRELLEKERDKALVTLHSIGDAVITTDADGRVEYLNPIAEELTGWSCVSAAGREIGEVFHIVNEITRKPADNPVSRCLAQGVIVGLANHTSLISRNGAEYIIEDSAAPIRDRNGRTLGAVLVFRDVTTSRLTHRKLLHMSQHDMLTGLKNRYFFEQQLQQSIDIAARGNLNAAVLYIDLDQFKVINDTAGHAAGDRLLVEVSRLLAARVRKGDLFARLGGDEFGVILLDFSQEQLEGIARSYASAVAEMKFFWNSECYEITCSIGIAVIGARCRQAAEVMRQADIACYSAKQSGRNRVSLYRPGEDKSRILLTEMNAINAIRSCLAQDGFEMHYQVVRDINTLQPVFHEALIRMKDSGGNTMEAGKFIPIAERNGLSAEIDRHVIARVLQGLIEELDSTLPVSINLSAVSLADSEVLGVLRRFIHEHSGLKDRLILEITETSAISHLEKAQNFMREICRCGVHIALDDFGTGFSTFSYLKHLPVQYIKIDGSFVRDVVDDPVDQAMVRSINHIAHSLNKITIAEFVENEEIVKVLKEIGVDCIQGYYAGRPAAVVHDR